MSVANNSPSQGSYHSGNLFQSRYIASGLKPFSYDVYYSPPLKRLVEFDFFSVNVLTVNVIREANEGLPNFTISFQDNKAVLQASESNELRCENFEVNFH